jgi:hypothetical protein
MHVFDADVLRNQQGLAFQPFDTSYTIEEAGSMQESSSNVFWVSSGGRLAVQDTIARTIQGDLSQGDQWFASYKNANPTDTDGGLHPQNIFRLVAKNVWGDARQELYYRFDTFNLSASPNRNATNGMFMMQRYKDAYNLYYTGIRVDGSVIVKKKIAGVYYTMGSARVFDGTYNRDTNPTLLPINQWMGFRTETVNTTTGGVTINVYTDATAAGIWTLALSVTDDGTQYGGPAFTTVGYSGLRTDFADVSMRGYTITDLTPTTSADFPAPLPPTTIGDYVDTPALTLPVITIAKPTNNGSYSKRKSISITTTASDPEGVTTITIAIDGRILKTCTGTALTSCSTGWNAKNALLGSHTITVAATDATTQITTSSSSITLIR